MANQADVDRWAGIVARAYRVAHVPFLPMADEESLARALNSPLANCIMLAIPPGDWGPHYVNPALRQWEIASRRGPGPRLQAVDYGQGCVTVR